MTCFLELLLNRGMTGDEVCRDFVGLECNGSGANRCDQLALLVLFAQQKADSFVLKLNSLKNLFLTS